MDLYEMMTLITFGDMEAFSMEELIAASTTYKLFGDDIVAVLIDSAGLRVSFVVAQFHSQEDGKPVMLSHVFHGIGYGGALRECRHTYWGESGYVFYPPGNLIKSAIDFLGEWFDM